MKNTSQSPSASPTAGQSKGMIIFLVVLVLLVLGAAGYYGYQLLFGSAESSDGGSSSTTPTPTVVTTTTTTPTEAPEVTPTPSPTPTTTAEVPAGWEAVDNTACGYTAYRPTHWYFRKFEGCALGMDPNPIPTASEYWGAVAVFKKSGTAASAAAALKGGLEAGATQETVTIAGREWIIVEGTVDGGEIFDDQHIKAGFISANGKTFEVASQLVPASFAMYEDELDKQMEIIVFN
jgi:hypothetical protein